MPEIFFGKDRPLQIASANETETRRLGASLARALFSDPRCFVRLQGGLGAGKSAFARGFIQEWETLSCEPVSENVISPTFNIVKTYGTSRTLAHLDLYRVSAMQELEQLGFEHYFFELSACLVEWLEQVPQAVSLIPRYAIEVFIDFDGKDPGARRITLHSQREVSLKT